MPCQPLDGNKGGSKAVLDLIDRVAQGEDFATAYR
jgi:hypothetical protein